uniref:Uncharacterized protein n=1 Tax=Magallana gigas TaxID=29159 RepID=A0A8W8NQ14_MAGGI
MDLRNGKSINNFQGMFPVRPTSAPNTAIGATPTAPTSIRMQSLQRARRLLSDLATPSSDRQSPDVPARPSLGPATRITIQGLKSELRQIVMPQSPDTLEKVRKLALVAEQTISSTETANASFAASIQQLEDRLMSS